MGRKSTAGALGGPTGPAPLFPQEAGAGSSELLPGDEIRNLEEREDAPAVQHLPAPLARLQVGAGYWEEAACLLRGSSICFGGSRSCGGLEPRREGFLCSHQVPLLSAFQAPGP